MEEFTGLNIEEAKKDLDFFDNECNAIHESLSAAVVKFFDELSIFWASQNAIAFGTKYSTKIGEFLTNFQTHYLHIRDGAASAAKLLASSNGTSFNIEKYYTKAGETGSNFAPDHFSAYMSETINGVTGMAVENVRIILKVFQNDASKLINSLNSLPKGIAFYSPDGALLEVYNTNIEKFVTQFEELANEMIGEINSYMETEIDNVLLAKQQAESIMNG